MRRISVAAWTLLTCMTIVADVAAADQPYPNRPIRIVTAAAGGGVDFAARLIAPSLSAALGQSVIVENRGGEFVLEEVVGKSAADGYSLLYTGNPFWLAPFIKNDLPFDTLRDFAPISLVVKSFSVLVVNPASAANSVKDLIAWARAKPGELNYASLQTGSGPHLSAELFKAMAGINIVSIRYGGAAGGLNDLIGNRVQLMFASATSAMSHVKSGRLRALAVTTAQPSELYPNLPTVAAAALPGYESVASFGLFAPIKTPAEIINRLSEEVARIVAKSEIKERFLNTGSEVVGSTPEQFVAAIKSDKMKLGKIIKDAGIHEK